MARSGNSGIDDQGIELTIFEAEIDITVRLDHIGSHNALGIAFQRVEIGALGSFACNHVPASVEECLYQSQSDAA